MTRRRVAEIVARVTLAVVGGYAFSAALSAALALALPLGWGLSRGDAVLLSAMLGFLVYLVALLWSFAEPRLGRVLAVLASGTLLGYAAVRWLLPLWSASSATGA
jgi:hypothetical protein